MLSVFIGIMVLTIPFLLLFKARKVTFDSLNLRIRFHQQGTMGYYIRVLESSKCSPSNLTPPCLFRKLTRRGFILAQISPMISVEHVTAIIWDFLILYISKTDVFACHKTWRRKEKEQLNSKSIFALSWKLAILFL